MLKAIKSAVILGLAATARGQQPNHNCEVTKNQCLGLSPNTKLPDCTTEEVCSQLFAYCGKVDTVSLNEWNECLLYKSVKAGTENSIPAIAIKLNIISTDALEKLLKSPNQDLESIIINAIKKLDDL